MKCYTARADGTEEGTIIIARSGSHAAEIFVTYWMAHHDAAPGAFHIIRNDLGQLPLIEELRAMMRGNVSGVVHFDQEDGHTLEPM